MARKKIKRFSPEQKLKIVKEGMMPDVRISDLCRHYGIYPTDYYRWKKMAEEAMLDGLKASTTKERRPTKKESELKEENEHLRSVIIQLTKEHVELKKKL